MTFCFFLVLKIFVFLQTRITTMGLGRKEMGLNCEILGRLKVDVWDDLMALYDISHDISSGVYLSDDIEKAASNVELALWTANITCSGFVELKEEIEEHLRFLENTMGGGHIPDDTKAKVRTHVKRIRSCVDGAIQEAWQIQNSEEEEQEDNY